MTKKNKNNGATTTHPPSTSPEETPSPSTQRAIQKSIDSMEAQKALEEELAKKEEEAPEEFELDEHQELVLELIQQRNRALAAEDLVNKLKIEIAKLRVEIATRDADIAAHKLNADGAARYKKLLEVGNFPLSLEDSHVKEKDGKFLLVQGKKEEPKKG